MHQTTRHICVSRRIDDQATQRLVVNSSRRTADDTVRVPVIDTCESGDQDRGRSLVDGEVLRVAAAGVIVVTTVGSAGRRYAGIDVVCIAHRQRLIESTSADRACRTWRLC